MRATCARKHGGDISRPQSLGPEICAGRAGGYRIHRPDAATGACAAPSPEILDTNTVAALHKLEAAGFLAAADADALVASARLQQALTQALRIALDDTHEDRTTPRRA